MGNLLIVQAYFHMDVRKKQCILGTTSKALKAHTNFLFLGFYMYNSFSYCCDCSAMECCWNELLQKHLIALQCNMKCSWKFTLQIWGYLQHVRNWFVVWYWFSQNHLIALHPMLLHIDTPDLKIATLNQCLYFLSLWDG